MALWTGELNEEEWISLRREAMGFFNSLKQIEGKFDFEGDDNKIAHANLLLRRLKYVTGFYAHAAQSAMTNIFAAVDDQDRIFETPPQSMGDAVETESRVGKKIPEEDHNFFFFFF